MTARTLQSDLRRLVGAEEGYKTLDPLAPVGARPGGVATGRPGGGTGSVLFAEVDYTQREYWPARTIYSSDGIFAIEAEPIKSILLEGNTRATFKEPVDPV